MSLHLDPITILLIVLGAGVFVAGTLVSSLGLLAQLFVWRAKGWSVAVWMDWLGGGWGMFLVGCLCLGASWAQADDVFLADETLHIALPGVVLVLSSPFVVIYAYVRYLRARAGHVASETRKTALRIEQPAKGVWPPPPKGQPERSRSADVTSDQAPCS